MAFALELDDVGVMEELPFRGTDRTNAGLHWCRHGLHD